MKLSHKLVMVSAAVLMGVSPVVGMAGNVAPVQAATKSTSGVHNTYGKNSKVKVTKTMKFVDRNGKRLLRLLLRAVVTLFGTSRRLMVKFTTVFKLT